MFHVTPVGKIVDPNDSWLTAIEQTSSCHWVIHPIEGGDEYRALYNELCYWVKVFRSNKNGSLLHLMDLQTKEEYDEEANESYLPNVSEIDIRVFFDWWEE